MKFAREEKILMDELKIGTESEMVKNPYSGREVMLCPEAVSLYNFIKECEALCALDENLYDKRFHQALDIFSKYFPKEYMILLD